MNLLKTFLGTLSTSKDTTSHDQKSFYDLEMTGLKGNIISFQSFKNKYVLIVNVASKCGFTSQYQELQQLQEQYAEKLIILGIPCNQFGAQEPGDATAISSFCELNYGVTFPMAAKVDVKGSHQSPVYEWLTSKSLNGKLNSNVKWNFQKYLVDPQGHLVDYYYSTTKPLSKKITKHLL